MNTRKILLSLGMLVFVGVVVAGATGAFFSDSETSTGNTFTAGSIDLALGADYSSENNGSGEVEMQSDNNGRALFNFEDLKPGDEGAGDFIMEITSNESYACALPEVVFMNENVLTDPEEDAGDTTRNSDNPDGGGELQNYIEFVFWNDADGNQSIGQNETNNYTEIYGPYTVDDIDGNQIALADTSGNTVFNAPMSPNQIYNLGYKYCFGEFDSNYDCQMSSANQNDAQTDQLEFDLTFTSVQSRNNEDFTCGELDEGDDEEEMTVSEEREGWPTNNDVVLAWQAEGRFGNNASNGDWEVGVGTNTQNPATSDSDQLNWGASDTSNDFTVDYNGTNGEATFTVEGSSATYNVGTSTEGNLYIVARSPQGNGDSTALTNLVLDGNPVGSTVTATNPTPNVTYIEISGVTLADGFTLTGTATFSHTTTSGSAPAFQVMVGN